MRRRKLARDIGKELERLCYLISKLKWSDAHVGSRRSRGRIETILEKHVFSAILSFDEGPLEPLIWNEAEMDVWEMGPILCRCAEGLPVGNVRVAGLDALDLILDEAVVRGWDPLPLLRRLVGRWGTLGGLLGLLLRGLGGCRHRHHRHVAGAAAVAAAREAAAAQVVAARLVHQQARRLERHIVQEAMRGSRGEQGVAELGLVCRRRRGREQEAAEVDGEQVGAVAAPHRHRLVQAAARHADLLHACGDQSTTPKLAASEETKRKKLGVIF